MVFLKDYHLDCNIIKATLNFAIWIYSTQSLTSYENYNFVIRTTLSDISFIVPQIRQITCNGNTLKLTPDNFPWLFIALGVELIFCLILVVLRAFWIFRKNKKKTGKFFNVLSSKTKQDILPI